MDSKLSTSEVKTKKPRVFIGSSREALEYAKAIKTKLQDVASLNIWNEDIWRPGASTLENLVNVLPEYDYAICILGGEDVTSSRGLIKDSPRDNIIFELGLFMGHLGRFRTFFVCRTDVDLCGLHQFGNCALDRKEPGRKPW
jgi:predicted nucleotide-binding protein